MSNVEKMCMNLAPNLYIEKLLCVGYELESGQTVVLEKKKDVQSITSNLNKKNLTKELKRKSTVLYLYQSKHNIESVKVFSRIRQIFLLNL